MYDIDLHIIHYKEPQWMLDRCLASLEGQPVNIHIIKGIAEWPLLVGRIEGFLAGDAPFVSCVDPDDTVKPGAFEKMLSFADNYDLIYGKEEKVTNGVVERIDRGVHHAYLARRCMFSMTNLYRHILTHIDAGKRKLRIKYIDEVFYAWNANEGHKFNKPILPVGRK